MTVSYKWHSKKFVSKMTGVATISLKGKQCHYKKFTTLNTGYFHKTEIVVPPLILDNSFHFLPTIRPYPLYIRSLQWITWTQSAHSCIPCLHLACSSCLSFFLQNYTLSHFEINKGVSGTWILIFMWYKMFTTYLTKLDIDHWHTSSVWTNL